LQDRSLFHFQPQLYKAARMAGRGPWWVLMEAYLAPRQKPLQLVPHRAFTTSPRNYSVGDDGALAPYENRGPLSPNDMPG
jgi:hypothetical protein